MYWCAMESCQFSVLSFQSRGGLTVNLSLTTENSLRCFANIYSHRAEETVLTADVGESRAPHQFRDAALSGVALEGRRDVEIGVRVAVEENPHGRHHRMKKRGVEDGGEGVARLPEIEDDGSA